MAVEGAPSYAELQQRLARVERELAEARGRVAGAAGEIAPLRRDLAEALAYAHEQGVVHRDVKPANVMLDDRGQPLLMDFGLAARLDETEKLTQEGIVLGTPLYASDWLIAYPEHQPRSRQLADYLEQHIALANARKQHDQLEQLGIRQPQGVA